MFFFLVHWEYLSGVFFLMGDGHTLYSLSFDWFFDWFLKSLIPLFLFFFAVFSLLPCHFVPWLEFAQFSFPCTFYFLIWHVVLMQNDKTGACECVCWIYFLKCKWFSCVCVYMCVWMQTRAVYSSGWISTCFMGAYVWAGSAQVILIDLNLRYPDTLCVSQKTHWYGWSFS